MFAVALALAGLLVAPGQDRLTLEIRTFRGVDEVSAKTRISVHRAGERMNPIAQMPIGGARTVTVPPGIYDAQAVQEQDGRVVGIRWAERLVVMPYPDEAGHHLEVINFTAGYGALQVRNSSGGLPNAQLALFRAGDRAQPVPPAGGHAPYILYVVPAGQYELQARHGSRITPHPGIDVPRDRTRLWIVP